MHFFHFPVRDWPRLERWASNADKLDFKKLELSKLKNKVVCEDHFRKNMFMNYLKESLTKTAVPTLEVLEDGNVYDLEMNVIEAREEWEVPQKQDSEREPLLVPVDEQNTRMEIQFLDADDAVEEVPIVNVTPVLKKSHPVLLNKTPNPVPIRLFQTESPKKVAASPTPPNAVLRKVVIKRKNTSPNDTPGSSKVQVLSIQRLPRKETFEPVEESPAADKPTPAMPSSSTDISTDTTPSVVPETAPAPPVPVLDPIYLEKLEQNSTEIAELKKLLVEVLNKPIPEPKVITVPVPTPAPQPPPSTEPTSPPVEKGPHMNKVQLFNGIKRYLNPTMVALLRMEMFGGSSERQWKTDEKALAVELLNLGDNVYGHFCDEFRFRLPSKKDVQKWKEQELEDDDAS